MRSVRTAKSGQVVVEMLLTLPVFLTIVFSIMEIGYVSFQVIVLNHATYEVARIGGMTTPFSSGQPQVNGGYLNDIMTRILKNASVDCEALPTIEDPQAGQQNYDLRCESTEQVKLIFPISSIILADHWGSGERTLHAVVRMPIEQPLKR
ncbi:MAG: pilus assembly protein [Elusimicrobia bacterium]|nr:pilus assembly protein [Elusimicrobiota bacterium]